MSELQLVEETVGVLWSVRTNGAVFLVVRAEANEYDIQAVADGGVEYLGNAYNHEGALKLIQAEING